MAKKPTGLGGLMAHKILVFALLAFLPLPALAEQPVRFGSAEISPPEGFSHSVEDGGNTIVLRPKRKELFTYRLTFHSLAQHPAAQRARLSQEQVAALAKKKRMQPYEIRGSAHVGFLDAGSRAEVNGVPMRNMEGAVDLKQGYATMTLNVPEKHANDPYVRDFLGTGIEALLATLRYVGK